jgi:hypothetical protein
VSSAEHQITKRAADGTMSIAELREFLTEYETVAAVPAGELGLGTGGAKPKARIAFGGGVKSITVTIPGEGQQ